MTNQGWNVHIHRNHVASDLYCKFCHKIFENTTTFGSHNSGGQCERNRKAKYERRQDRRRSLLVKCDDCGKTLRKYKLKEHIRFVHQMIFFPCDLCDIKLPTEKQLFEHKEYKHEGKGPMCKKCDYVARFKQGLQKHMKIIHEVGRVKRFPCSLEGCDKTNFNQVGLNRHIQFHQGEKPFQCNECGKSFIQKGTLKEHLRVHSGEKPFICPTCKKAFSQASGLKSHKELHNSNGEKRVKCFPCKKGFTQASALKFHEKYHNKKKAFRCLTFCIKCLFVFFMFSLF